MKKYSAVVVGCGRIGIEEGSLGGLKPQTHAQGYYLHPRTALSALVDIRKERLKLAQKYYPDIPTFTSVEEMIVQVEPDIISVATTTPTHYNAVKAAAKKGVKAIICEKPIAQNISQAEKMISLCRKRNILLFVNHSRRFDKLIRSVKKKINYFGPIVQGNGQYVRGIYNNGTHLIDLLRFYLGEVEQVWAVRNTLTEKWQDLEDDLNLDGFIFFKNGAKIAIQSMDATDYYIFELSLFGRNGIIHFTDLAYKIAYQPKLKKAAVTKKLGEFTKTDRITKSTMLSMIDHVVDCLDGKDKPVSTGKDGLAVLKVINALVESYKKDSKIQKLSV